MFKPDRRPFSSVLVATDFSEGARAAARRLAGLPLAPDASVELLHVAETRDAARAAREPLAEEEAVLRSRSPKVELTATVATGRAFVEIVRRARAAGAELVVLGRHGTTRLPGRLPGTTARRVLRKAGVPVLAVARRSTRPYARPLVPVDLTDASRAVLQLAVRACGGRPECLHVVHAFHVPFSGLAGDRSLRAAVVDQARETCGALLAPFGEAGVPMRSALAEGDARTVILTEVARLRPDVVVLGTHARSGLAHALLGSVAEWVVDSVPGDVLVARPVRFSFEPP